MLFDKRMSLENIEQFGRAKYLRIWSILLVLLLGIIFSIANAQDDFDITLNIDTLVSKNAVWSVDSQQFVFSTGEEGNELGPGFTQLAWREYDLGSDALTSATMWPLQPVLTSVEQDIFQPEGYLYGSPNEQLLLYANRGVQGPYFALASRPQQQFMITNHPSDGVNSPEFMSVLWNDQSLGVVVDYVSEAGEAKVFFAHISNANDLQDTQFYEFNQNIAGVNYFTIVPFEDRVHDISGTSILLVGRSSEVVNLGNPSALSPQLIIWSPLEPELSRVIDDFDINQIVTASFAPNDETKLLILQRDASLVQYDLSSGQTTTLSTNLGSSVTTFFSGWFSLDGAWLVVQTDNVLRFLNIVRFLSELPSASVTPIATSTATSTIVSSATPTPTFTATPTFTPTTTSTPTPTYTPAPTSPVTSFVILGQEGVWLEQDSTVVSGDVGANIATSGPFLAEGSEVTVGIGVEFLNPTSEVFGDSVYVRQGGQVYDVHYNQLQGQGQVLGQQFTPLTLPVVSALPTVPSFTAGTQNVNVSQNGSITLNAGSYGTLQSSQGATITFAGGIYNFQEWNLGMNNNVVFAAPTEIRIAGRLRVEQGSYVGPATGTSLDAADIVFYVTGQNGNTGNIGATPKAAIFGINNTLVANVYAPNGTLWIRQGSTARGAFLARWVDIGIGVAVTLESAF